MDAARLRLQSFDTLDLTLSDSEKEKKKRIKKSSISVKRNNKRIQGIPAEDL